MALKLRNVAGPEIPDGRNYNAGAALPAGVSILAAPTPDGGSYWIEATGGSLTPFTILTQLAPSPSLALWWIALTAFRLVTTPPATDVIGVLRYQTATPATDPREVVALFDGTTGVYKLALRTTAGVVKAQSISSFAVGQDVSILLEFENGLVRLYANGQIELQWISAPPSSNALECLTLKSTANAVTRRWRGFTTWESDTAEDRPDPVVEIRGMFPVGPGVRNEFGDMVDPANGLASYAHWDDYLTGVADDDTTYNACPPVFNLEQLSTLSDVAVSKEIRGVLHRARARNATSTKPWPGNAVLRYNGQIVIRPVDVGTANVYGPELALWNDPGGPWTQGLVNGMEGGAATEQAGGVGIERRWTAIAWEVAAADPFPKTERPGVKKTKGKRTRTSPREAGLELRSDREEAAIAQLEADREALDRAAYAQELDDEFAVLRRLYGF